jgi:hypothetical protein
VSDESQLDAFRAEPSLVFRVPARSIEQRERVKDAALTDANAPWRPIGPADSGYAYRVVAVQDDLAIAGREVSVAIVDVRTPAGEFRRWVFDDPTMSRDLRPGEDPMAAMRRGGESFVDGSLEVEYRPGNGLALALLVAGPEAGRLRLVDALGREEARVLDLRPGEPVALAAGVTLSVASWIPNAVEEVRPAPVPPAHRVREARAHGRPRADAAAWRVQAPREHGQQRRAGLLAQARQQLATAEAARRVPQYRIMIATSQPTARTEYREQGRHGQ